MPGDLLIHTEKSLDEFVASMQALLGCPHWEQRQSSNYVEERYYRCIVLGVQVTAAIGDSAEFREYEMWLFFEPHGIIVDSLDFLDGIADCVARTLALAGHHVLRPLNDSRIGSGAIRYELDPKAVRLSERVRTIDV